jgi:hypothetical protein
MLTMARAIEIINGAESVRAEREVIIARLNAMIANATQLDDHDGALAYECARNYIIRRQDGSA